MDKIRTTKSISKRHRKRQRATRAIFASLIVLAVAIASLIALDVLRNRSQAAGGSSAEQTPMGQLSIGQTPTGEAPQATLGIERVTPSAAPLPSLMPLPSVQPVVIPNSTPVPMPPPKAQEAGGEPDYSFYWFTDPQYYTSKYPETLQSMIAWMRDNAAAYNVKYAFLTGDLVNDNTSSQWEFVDTALRQLESAVPLFTIAGNHDVGTSSPDYTNYNKYFGPSRYGSNPNIVGWYDGAKGRCDSVEIDGTKYLFAGLGWKSGTGGINWLNKQLEKYADHHAILFFHDYMNSEGLLSDTGQELYEKVVKPNPNVFMVLCGHRYNCALLTTDIHDNGDRLNYRRVYNILMNYQAFDNGGDGFLALIRVYKKDRIITFDTYSPKLNKWYQFDPARNINREQLTLPVTIFD